MNSQTSIALIVFLVVFIGSIVFDSYMRKKRNAYADHIVKLVASGKFDEFDKEINSDEAKKNIPPANIDILKFNVALICNKQDEVIKIFDSFNNKRLSNDAKLTIYSRALGYFISINDIERCKVCYEKIMALPKNEQTKASVQRVYDIMVEKKTNYLNELLKEVESLEDSQKYLDEFLISEIYTNLNDVENANKYAELAKDHLMANTPKE